MPDRRLGAHINFFQTPTPIQMQDQATAVKTPFNI